MSNDFAQTTRVSFKCPEPTVDALDALDDDSRSEHIRRAVDDYLDKHTDTDGGRDVDEPEDDRLARALRRLRYAVDGRRQNRVTLDAAESRLYDERTPKDTVRTEYLRPLERLGYVKVKPSINDVYVYVKPPQTPRETSEGHADA